ncbi:MAG: aminoacyl-tRNA hydrolase [Spirochaetales bacterium]|nr:MAG: aminoacyl-tRNA hydrolase [Spirochaetales bacterium]
MKLIIGLGNPGKEYAHNRHNVGFQCLDYFARRHRIELKERRWRERSMRARFGTGDIDGTAVVLAKPTTFMNLSGQAVSQMMHRFKASLADIIVICDDMDLPLGKIRIRPQGGSGGHKGIASIINSAGSDTFIRVRVGIGRPEKDEISFVLSNFPTEDKQIIDKAVAQVADIIDCILHEGCEPAMNQ